MLIPKRESPAFLGPDRSARVPKRTGLLAVIVNEDRQNREHPAAPAGTSVAHFPTVESAWQEVRVAHAVGACTAAEMQDSRTTTAIAEHLLRAIYELPNLP